MITSDELVHKLAEKGYLVKDSEMIIRDVFETIREVVCSGESVGIYRFGTFNSVVYPEHKIRSAHDGEIITIPDRAVPKFSASRAFKREMREHYNNK